MAGGEENGPEGSLGEPLPPPDEPSQPLAEGFPKERARPGGEDEQEEKGEEEESEGSEDHLGRVLDEDTAAEGLHTFGRSAPGTEYVYLHLSLPGRGLSDISILSGYIHLQKMELSSNKINDLSCVSHMPYLVELNASKNKLTTYFNFRAPKNLREVDFSHNHIPKMKDLSEYHSLTKLLLDFNEIEEIRGLEECHSLTQLGLSHNRLAAIRGLHSLPIRVLNLSFNQIEKVDGLKSLKNLQCVNLSHNKINSLQGLEEHDLLEAINLEDNQVAELSELKWIENLPLLRDLNLLKNPLQEKGSYWLSAIFMLLQVTDLDLKKVSVEEKVAAVNKEAPPPETVAAEDHRTHLLYHSLQPQGILNSTLATSDDPYPMLVLLGPVAGGRRQLSLKLCRQFKTFFRFGPCHTTRKAYFGEENRLDYHFISEEEFDKMVKSGRFLATYKYSGHRYGLARSTLESIAREGQATCVHMEIEGVRSLKRTHFRPRCILLVPKDKEKYREHLRRTGLFSRPEMEEAVSRVDMYLQISQDYPGYFDVVINTDDLEEALTDLSLVVKVYLGMEPPNVLENFEGFWSQTGSWNQIIPEEMPAPSYGDLLHISAKNYPRDLLEMLTATPGSVEEASLRRRFSAARQVLLSHRALDPDCEASLQLLPRPVPPLPSGASRVTTESSFMGLGLAWRQVFVPPEAALAGLEQLLWPKLPLPQRHLSAAPLGVHTSRAWNEAPESPEPEEEEPAGCPLRKCSRASSARSAGPRCPSRRVLPPIPPRWRSSDP
ncbi:leucine-rich repeat and guanylate kinase domain-containing protein isoform X2 [Agelaius tricolor]|uniref:leucine-rich repeat and guanylate kinase domain-containing protein isoform X2 n=1 Tax=Agelaius tricolor TaxID=9191 RepID=UPI0039F228BB